jgi:hypothetical protein
VNNLILEKSYKFKFDAPLISAIDNIINSIEGHEGIKCDGYDGYSDLELVIATHLSSSQNGREIKLPIQSRDLGVLSRQTSFTEDGNL